MKLWNKLITFLFGQRLYVTLTNGRFCMVKGVRRIDHYKGHVYAGMADVQNVAWTRLWGWRALKAEFRDEQIVAISTEQP